MNKDGILYLLEEIGVYRVYRDAIESVQTSCPLARWTHEKKREDRKPSMGIKIVDNGQSYCHCFTCQWRGTLLSLILDVNKNSRGKHLHLIEFVRKNELRNLGRSVGNLRTRYGLQKSKKKKKIVHYSEMELRQFKGTVPKYILKRGFTKETCKAWELGYDKVLRRVVIPIRDEKFRLVGMVGRTVVDHEIKFRNYWNFQKRHFLFGEQWELSADKVILVESMFDVLWLWQNGYEAIGTFGAQISKEQVRKIVRYCSYIIVIPHNDSAGNDYAKNARKTLRGKINFKVRRIQDCRDLKVEYGMDICDIQKSELEKVVGF